MLSAQTLERLKEIDTATICNVIELFDARPRDAGYMDRRIVAAFPEMPPMVGFAATATFRASGPIRQGETYSGLDAQVERLAELSGPAVVVFQDLDDPPVAATFGEVMCTTYRAFGAVGLITSGAGRDLAQVRALGFPVFTNGAICSHGYSRRLDMHVPVRVGGIVIYPDDLLHGDANGVTTIPANIADQVADIAPEFMQAEAVVIDAMREQQSDAARLRAAYAEMRSQIAKLRARVK